MTLTIDKRISVINAVDGDPISTCDLVLDARKQPMEFDTKEVKGLGVGSILKGIWKFEGDTLIWCFSPKVRPRSFESKDESDVTLMVLKRQKPK